MSTLTDNIHPTAGAGTPPIPARLARLSSVAEFRLASRATLPRFSFDFIDGGAEDEVALQRNSEALASWLWQPAVATANPGADVRTSLFGVPQKLPFGIGPTGLNGLLWPRADLLLARAARQAGCPFVLATTGGVSIEEIGEACPSNAWLQLYLFKDRRVTWQMVERAAAAGFAGLIVTLDVPVIGKRERDLRNNLSLPLRPTLRNACAVMRHPGWAARFARHGVPTMANLGHSASSSLEKLADFVHRQMDGSIGWADISEVRRRWAGPLVVKGILLPADALRATEAGADGIVVSNHGGRQLDATVASIDVLERIANVAGRATTVMFDGGIRRGGDVLKAAALGAAFSWIARPTLYGVSVGGEAGARRVLDILKDEAERSLALLGAHRLDQISRDMLFDSKTTSEGRRP